MDILKEITEVLLEDPVLLQNLVKFAHSLEIPRANVDHLKKRYDLGHCSSYDLMHGILSEWIALKPDSATVAQLRRILEENYFRLCAVRLIKLQEKYPGPIKTPGVETSSGNDWAVPDFAGNQLKLEDSWLKDYKLIEFIGVGSCGGVYKPNETSVTDNAELQSESEVVLEAKEYSANEFVQNIRSAKRIIGSTKGSTIVTDTVKLICNNCHFENIYFRRSVTVVGSGNKFSKITVTDATDISSGLIIYGSDNVLDDISVYLTNPDKFIN